MNGGQVEPQRRPPWAGPADAGRRASSTGTATTTSSASRRAPATSSPRRTRSRPARSRWTWTASSGSRFIKDEHPKLNYGTAAVPGRRQQAGPLRRRLRHRQHHRHPEDARSTRTRRGCSSSTWRPTRPALAELSNGLQNVPTTQRLAEVAGARRRCPAFQTFLDVFANANTTTTPITRIGAANQETLPELHREVAGSGSKTRPRRRARERGQADRRAARAGRSGSGAVSVSAPAARPADPARPDRGRSAARPGAAAGSCSPS